MRNHCEADGVGTVSNHCEVADAEVEFEFTIDIRELSQSSRAAHGVNNSHNLNHNRNR